MKKLYLASASVQRKRLLHEAGISFKVVEHVADEKSCPWKGELEPLTRHLAQLKMDHVTLQQVKTSDGCFVLTADTLTCLGTEIIGKPRDHADAIEMIKRVRDGVLCGTAFCIEQRYFDETILDGTILDGAIKNCSTSGGVWQVHQRYTGYAHGWCSLSITDDEIVPYFKYLAQYSGFDYQKLAGAFSITGYGAQFLKEVRGSYTAILGLPMAELRAGLKSIGFFS